MKKAISPLKDSHQRPRSCINVHFEADDMITVRTFEVPDDIPNQDLWYTADEFDAIKSRSRSDCREWRKMGYVNLLKNAFEQPTNDVQSYINVFCALDGALNRRGLERQCSRKHGEERSDCKDRARHSVLDAQFHLSEQGVTGGELANSISAAYITTCREARIFARRVGQADELALNQDQPNDQIEILLASCRPKMQRRLSNYSTSTHSNNSFDSASLSRQAGVARAATRPKTHYPGSPVSSFEELYAAIA